jgi:serine protease inhibitor
LNHGWANPQYKIQLKIHDYKNEDNFIFQMGCKDSLDEIYFAKIPPKANLKRTYDEVINRLKKNNIEYIDDFEEIQIPYLKFDIENHFENFQNISISIGQNPLVLDYLFQRIQFDLNKDGVKLESSATSSISLGISDVEPRIYAFDQPFLIVLKRKGETSPYFLYWVENSEHMEIMD